MAVIFYVILFSRESASDILNVSENLDEFAGQAK
jgi:hypothetical protein